MGTRTDPGFYGKGFYFVSDIENAKRWGENVISSKINLKNPLIINGITDFIKASNQPSVQTLRENLTNNEIEYYKNEYKKTKQIDNFEKWLEKKLYEIAVNIATQNLTNDGYDGVIYSYY